MRILITRPEADAHALAARLAARGHTTFVEPLIEIAFAPGPPLDLSGVQALLLTSANGARAAARRTAERALPVFAVGPATGAEARAQGFTAVSESTGDGVDALAAHVRALADPAKGVLLHVTGTVTAGDLKASLAPDGFAVRIERLYDARAASGLSGALIAELEAGLIDAAMFFSPRTAALFANLSQAAGIEAEAARLTALALSPAVAAALGSLTFRQVLVPPHPTGEAMLDLVPSRP